MIRREDIKLSYSGGPDTGLMLEATYCQKINTILDDDQKQNILRAERIVFDIIDNLYGDIRESLIDILEEYKMRHMQHVPRYMGIQNMIQSLIDNLPK